MVLNVINACSKDVFQFSYHYFYFFKFVMPSYTAVTLSLICESKDLTCVSHTFLRLSIKILNIFILRITKPLKTSSRNDTIGWSVWKLLRNVLSLEVIYLINFNFARISGSFTASWSIWKTFSEAILTFGDYLGS